MHGITGCSWIIKHAFYNNLIKEEEAWNLLKENGDLIKQSFTSWENFGLSYLVGSQYWNRKTLNIASMKEAKSNITYLLSNKNSPWFNIDWNDYV